jgi:hypothetical protein
MKDKIFKNLPHNLGNLITHTTGGEVAKGYKPDFTAKDHDGLVSLIMECESKTDRKAYLGDFIKAEKFSHENGLKPVLVIVVTERKNTKIDQLCDHLIPYIQWIRSLNTSVNVRELLFISDINYKLSLKNKEVILSNEFRTHCKIIISSQA